MDEDEFLTIEQVQATEIKVKGSTFIGTAGPVITEQQAADFIQQVSQKYYDATHHCYAYQIGLNPSIIFRMSDAGEPAGTAGAPIFNVIRGKQLTNLAVVVTRYFGGTKLGKGGLARAYSECTQKVLEQCSLVKKYIYQTLRLEFDYHLTNSVMRVISSFHATILHSSYDQSARLTVSLRKSMADNFKLNLIELTSGKISIAETT